MTIQKLLLGASVLALSGGGFAAAQTTIPPTDTPGPPVQSPAGGAASVAVSEVIVTAQRRAQSVQAIPAAITAISGASLDQRGITNVNELQFLVPSLRSGTLTGSTDITIRGVGVGAGSSPGVAVNVDGVYQPQTTTADQAQIDLQRVEVLRGPQGTLYGRNATGGAVNFITNAPTSTFGGSLLAGYATYDEYHLQAVLNAPVNDRIRTRFLVDYDDRQDGFVKNVNSIGEDEDKGKKLSGRFRLSADITPDLVFDLGITAVRDTGSFQYLSNFGAPAPIAFALNPFLANATFISRPFRTDTAYPTSDARDYQSVSGTFTWRLPFGTLKSITAYQNYRYYSTLDGASTNIVAAPDVSNNRDHSVTQEFDLTGSLGQLDYVLGVFYLSEADENSLSYSFPNGLTGLPPGGYLDFEQPRYDTTSYAGFADATWHVTKSLKLIAGARYSEDREDATYGGSLGVEFFGQRVPLATTCQETDHLKYDSFTPRAGIQYDISQAMNVYFTFSKGYKAGGANIYSCNDDYAPEKITSYEVGYKSRWFDNSVTLNLSAFHYDYTNFQVSQIVGLSLEVTNAAAAKVDGVELESAWSPDNHWSLNANFSYINAVYEDFSNVDGLNPQLGLQNLDGNLLDNSPRESGDIGVAYRTDPFSFGRFTARVDASYSSRVFFREFNAPLDSQSPYGLVNLNLLWDSPDRKYTVRVYGTNLANQAYAQNQGSSTSIGTRYIAYGPPRQIGVELKAHF